MTSCAMRPSRTLSPAMAVLVVAVAVLPLAGQEAAGADSLPDRDATLRVFLDCQTGFGCDRDFLRREIGFVEFVRDRAAAEVHALVTSQSTGGGGRSFTLSLLGRQRFEGLDDEIRFSVRANLADERVLQRTARRLGLGLARYAARTADAGRLRIAVEGGVREPSRVSPAEDPWNFWVFEVGLSAGLSGEERSSSIRLSGDASANRVTEDLKLELDLEGDYSERDFEVDDTTRVTSLRRSYEAEGLAVWSLGPHWSAGVQASAEQSSFRNQELGLRLAPGVEYNLFRYEDSERKQLSFLYTVGPEYFDWKEETLLGETSELRARQRLEVSLNVRQPWGSSNGRFEASSFLHDRASHRLELFGGLSLRVTEGLSVNVFGSAARVQDQINLPAGDATEEEILLRLRELRTDFRYSLSVGFGYTFGSIYSSVVNPRF